MKSVVTRLDLLELELKPYALILLHDRQLVFVGAGPPFGSVCLLRLLMVDGRLREMTRRPRHAPLHLLFNFDLKMVTSFPLHKRILHGIYVELKKLFKLRWREACLPSSLSLWVYIVSGFVLWQVLDLAGLSFAVALVSTATFVRFWTLLRLAALLVQDLHLALKELSVVLVLLVSASLPLGRARIWRPALTAIVALLA